MHCEKIHENAFIHESSYVDDNVTVGSGTKILTQSRSFELSDRRGLLLVKMQLSGERFGGEPSQNAE